MPLNCRPEGVAVDQRAHSTLCGNLCKQHLVRRSVRTWLACTFSRMRSICGRPLPLLLPIGPKALAASTAS